jgi:phospholipid/cholesterol/gamma-HCH transport system substrate-binding protein
LPASGGISNNPDGSGRQGPKDATSGWTLESDPMELHTRQEKLAGTFVIGIAILLLATVIIIGRGKDWFVKYVSYYTIMPQSYNLEKNAAVKLFNTDIGKVKEIHLEGDIVKILILIKQDFAHRIRIDSVATVKSPTLLGTEHVSIKPGSPQAALIPKDGQIPSEPRKALSDILEEFEVEKTAKAISVAVQDLSDIIKILKTPKGPLFSALTRLNDTLAHVDSIASHVNNGQGTLGRLLKSDKLIVDIRKKIKKLDPILDALAKTTSQAPAIMAKIDPILEDIGQTTQKAPQTVKQIQENLAVLKKIETEALGRITEMKSILAGTDKAIANLNIVLADVAEASHDIPTLLKNSQTTIADVRNAIENLDKIFQALQKNILIRSEIPPEPKGRNVDAGLR